MRHGTRTIGWPSVVMIFGMLGPDVVRAQCPELDKLLASQGEAFDNYGSSVAIDGSLAVVGAALEDGAGLDHGAAYVYRFDGSHWVEEQRLVAGDGEEGDWFGYSVAVVQDPVETIAVGAWYDDESGGVDSGSVYVFQHSGGSWQLDQKLIASDATAGAWFGTDVALDGDALLVGAMGDNVGGEDRGSAYLFRSGRFGWLEEAKLTGSAGGNWDYFGSVVDVEGDVALIAAASADPGVVDGGAAYVYRKVGGVWTEEQILVASDAAAADFFGAGVDLDGEVAVIGSFLDDDAGIDSGSAYVYRYDGSSWIEEAKLIAPDGADHDRFGWSVAADDGCVLIGAPLDDEKGFDSGSGYTFASRGNAWAFDQKLAMGDGNVGDWGGLRVAIDGSRAIMASHLDDDLGLDSGSAGIFSVNEFALTATPEQVQAGDSLTFEAYCGTPATPVLLATADINGIPFFYTIIIHRFGADHRFTLSASVPDGLAGIDITFLAFKFDAFDKIVASNLTTVQFQ